MTVRRILGVARCRARPGTPTSPPYYSSVCCFSSSPVTIERSSSSSSDSTHCYDQIPPEIESIVAEYSSKQPTSASLQTLLQTGRGNGGFHYWEQQRQHQQQQPIDDHDANYHRRSSYNLKRGSTPLWGRLGERMASERILIQMAAYLRHELPVRLAHRIQDLDQVPHMRDMEAVQAVKGIYIHSLLDLTNSPSRLQTREDEQAFAELLGSLYQKHAGVLVEMAKGAYQLRQQIRKHQKEQRRRIGFPTSKRVNPLKGEQVHDFTELTTEQNDLDLFQRIEECQNQFLDRFYMSRIGIRFLAGQYLSLRSETTSSINDPQPPQVQQQQHYIGMICQKTSPSQCVRQAAADASMMCRRTYGRCPRVEVTGRLDLTFPYIPTYLHYILLELLKNALRATMEAHRNSPVLPPVGVIIADGTENEDVVIKITDEGGGIPRSQVDKIWSYLFTTADPKIQEYFIGDKAQNSNKDHSKESPLAGLGYGLPISRSYCRYFGGDLDLISMEGFGTDAFVHLKRLGDSKEPVPV